MLINLNVAAVGRISDLLQLIAGMLQSFGHNPGSTVLLCCLKVCCMRDQNNCFVWPCSLAFLDLLLLLGLS